MTPNTNMEQIRSDVCCNRILLHIGRSVPSIKAGARTRHISLRRFITEGENPQLLTFKSTIQHFQVPECSLGVQTLCNNSLVHIIRTCYPSKKQDLLVAFTDLICLRCMCTICCGTIINNYEMYVE